MLLPRLPAATKLGREDLFRLKGMLYTQASTQGAASNCRWRVGVPIDRTLDVLVELTVAIRLRMRESYAPIV